MSQIGVKKLEAAIKENKQLLPRHIAFIMDGNGRWAKARNMPRQFGHREGVKSVREMVECGVELGVKVMTFYTFSVENWKRPKQEVSALMKLLVSSIRKEVDDMDKNNVTLRMIGRIDDLPERPRKELEDAERRLSGNSGLIFTLALSYGGRQEIIRAFTRLQEKGIAGIKESDIDAALDTAGLPDPDLLIRTSGEMRISNFLLWQCAYSELYVTATLWPDFRKKQLYEAIWDYMHRERRFGCISEQLVET